MRTGPGSVFWDFESGNAGHTPKGLEAFAVSHSNCHSKQSQPVTVTISQEGLSMFGTLPEDLCHRLSVSA